MSSKTFTTLFSAGLLSLSLHVNAKPILKFATEATYPPFVSMTSHNKMVGLGPDVVHAICHIMKRKCVLVNAPWASLIPSLEIGKFDALFGGMGITKAREKVVNFTLPYYENASTFVVKKSGTFPLNDAGVEHKTIAAQSGSTFAQYIQKKFGCHVTLKTYASNMTALLDLKSGRVNAVFLDKPVATTWIKKQKSAQYTTEGNITDPAFFGPGNAIAVNMNNKALLKNIDQALDQMKANGTLQKLEKKWVGSNKC